MVSHIVVLRSGDARRFDLPGIQFTGFAAPSRGSHQLCAWLIDVVPGLVSPEPHTLDRDEVFIVTAGTLRLHADGELLSTGDVAVVPAEAPIQLSNPGPDPASAYVIVSAGFSAAAADGAAIGTPPWAT